MTKVSVLFHLHHLYYLPQFLPVARALECDGNFDVWYSAAIERERYDYYLAEKIISRLGGKFISADTEKERIGKLLEKRFDVVVFGKSRTAEKYCRSSAMAVLLYHGIGFKTCYYTDYNPRINVRYVESAYRLEELRRRRITTELVVTGFPKIDALFDESRRDDYLNRLGIERTKPVVLYAPTFYPSSIEIFGEELARQTRDFNLIVKLHHFSWLMKKYHHQRDLFLKLCRKYPHVKLVSVEEFNIIPLFQISDVLLTEASSTAFEYLATGRPVIVADFVHLRWKHRLMRRRFERQRLDTVIIDKLDFAYHLAKPEDLPITLKAALTDSENKRAIMLQKRNLFLGAVDGQAAARVVQDLKKRLAVAN